MATYREVLVNLHCLDWDLVCLISGPETKFRFFLCSLYLNLILIIYIISRKESKII